MLSRFFQPGGGGSGLTSQSDPFGTFQREMNRVFDEVFRGFPAMRQGAALMGGFAPNLDVHETERGLEITAELPGMAEADIDLKLEGDLLTLSGEKKLERKQEEGGMHLSERSYGRFQRAFRLPYAPDPQQVEAQFDKGVLRIALPRPQQQQQGSRIQIRSGGQGRQGLSGGQALSGGQPLSGGSSAERRIAEGMHSQGGEPQREAPGGTGGGGSGAGSGSAAERRMAEGMHSQSGEPQREAPGGTGSSGVGAASERDNRPGRSGTSA